MSVEDATYGRVEHTEHLTPSMVRVVLGGAGLEGFEMNEHTDAYMSLLFLPPGSPLTVPFDETAAKHLPAGERPVPRRFTVRRWEADTRRLTVDFVVHGDVGVAGRWARNAQPGDLLQLRGPAGGYAPRADADWHLFIGDESALPAIAAALDALPAGVPARLVALVDGADDELEVSSPADLQITWLHRDPTDEDQLSTAVAGLEFPAGRVHGFVHGEAAETRSVRRHLLADRGVAAEDLSLSPYWRRTMTDEAWREVKRDFLAAQARDV